MKINELNSDIWPDSRIWSALNCAGFAVYRLRELELARFGLTIEQSSILYILQRHYEGSATIQELVNETIRQPNSVYTLISRMSNQGLVSKVEQSDVKRVSVEISPAGQDILKKMTNTSLEMAFSGLTAKDKARLADILHTLINQSRELLGIPYKLPLLQFLDQEKTAQKLKSTERYLEDLTDAKLWSILDCARFAVSRLRELELARFGLTIEQSSILYILRDHGGSTIVQELVDDTMRQPNSVYTLINRMVKMGLVYKVEKSDEKRVSIEITPGGQEKLLKTTTASLEMAFSVLTLQDKIELPGLLKLIIEKTRNLLGIPEVRLHP